MIGMRRMSRVHLQAIHPSAQDCLHTVLVSPSYSPIRANTWSTRGDRIDQWLCGYAPMGAVFFDRCGQSTRDTGSGGQGSFISTSLLSSHNTAVLDVYPRNTDILHSPAHSVPSVVPFQHRFLARLFAIRACEWPDRSKATGHADSTHATDNGGRSVSYGQWNDKMIRHSDHGCSNAIILGSKPDIWRVDCIGEGAFRNAVCIEPATVWYTALILHEGDRN